MGRMWRHRDRMALVVDPDWMARAATKVYLERRGYLVLTAEDGADAVDLAPLAPFSLIVTELDMRRMDGLDFIRRIRRMGGELARLPIIVLAAREPLEPPEALGFDAFALKGADLDCLGEAVDRLAAPARMLARVRRWLHAS